MQDGSSMTTNWYPSRLLSPTTTNALPSSVNTPPPPSEPYAVVILNQPINKPALTAVLQHASILVCADAGGDRYLDYIRATQQEQQDENKHPHGLRHIPNNSDLSPPSTPQTPTNHNRTRTSKSQQNQPPSPSNTNTTTTTNTSTNTFTPRIPDAIVGDLDSLTQSSLQHWTHQGVEIVHNPDQYSTDFTKSLKWLRHKWTSQPHHTPNTPLNILVLGGLGGRVDQGFSQIHHLLLAQKDTTMLVGKLYLLSEQSLTFILNQGRNEIWVEDWPSNTTTTTTSSSTTTKSSSQDDNGQGQTISSHDNNENSPHEADTSSVKRKKCSFRENVGIIPITGPSKITTQGFEWDVSDWQTEFGGQMSTSNHIRNSHLVVNIAGDNKCLFTMELASHLQMKGEDS